jgi:hypothetical protein
MVALVKLLTNSDSQIATTAGRVVVVVVVVPDERTDIGHLLHVVAVLGTKLLHHSTAVVLRNKVHYDNLTVA